MPVSPFDGANRIRFKGSWLIVDLIFTIADLKTLQNRQLEIYNRK
jgi:hypothetical protein